MGSVRGSQIPAWGASVQWLAPADPGPSDRASCFLNQVNRGHPNLRGPGAAAAQAELHHLCASPQRWGPEHEERACHGPHHRSVFQAKPSLKGSWKELSSLGEFGGRQTGKSVDVCMASQAWSRLNGSQIPECPSHTRGDGRSASHSNLMTESSTGTQGLPLCPSGGLEGVHLDGSSQAGTGSWRHPQGAAIGLFLPRARRHPSPKVLLRVAASLSSALPPPCAGTIHPMPRPWTSRAITKSLPHAAPAPPECTWVWWLFPHLTEQMCSKCDLQGTSRSRELTSAVTRDLAQRSLMSSCPHFPCREDQAPHKRETQGRRSPLVPLLAGLSPRMRSWSFCFPVLTQLLDSPSPGRT